MEALDKLGEKDLQKVVNRVIELKEESEHNENLK